MPTTAASTLDPVLRAPAHVGLRMSADEFFSLEDDGFKYELVDGVTIRSPSPTPGHQQVADEILFQLKTFLRGHRVGAVYRETDIHLSPGLVYRPELVFLRTELVRANWRRIRTAPDLVVEVVSPESRRFDRETKKADYERHGVREYWIIEPQLEAFTFFRLVDGRFVDIPVQGDAFTSEAVTGFVLDLAAVRAAFQPLL
ncbi:MAG: Uma2 family endonuclease [Phycisphaerales bacterium]|nr:Uma2 family endonuclease [Phycisphaerales bacterium]